MLFSLLDGANGQTANGGNNWVSYVLIGVLVVVLVVSMIIMNRRSKKREQEAKELMDAVKPGNKVTTIGGIVGIVVETNPDDNTIVVETGSEDHGKCYIKFIRQAIYESDAVVDKNKDEVKTKEAEAPAEETATEEVSETATEEKPKAE